MLGYYRAQRGFVRKDRRREAHSVRFKSSDGTTQYQEIKLNEFPSVMILPVYGDPGLLAGTPIGGQVSYGYFTSPPNFAGVIEHTAEPLQQGSYTISEIRPEVFGQMLAKIALGIAVLRLGIEGFKPLIRNFILSNKKECGHWIGGPLGQPNEPPADVLHEIGFDYIETDHTKYISVPIRLFANLGCPRNYVIVGELL